MTTPLSVPVQLQLQLTWTIRRPLDVNRNDSKSIPNIDSRLNDQSDKSNHVDYRVMFRNVDSGLQENTGEWDALAHGPVEEDGEEGYDCEDDGAGPVCGGVVSLAWGEYAICLLAREVE